MVSLLGSLASGAVEWEPFPHIVLADAVPHELYAALAQEYPPMEWITGTGSAPDNRRFNRSAAGALADARLSERWRALIRFHTSQVFLDQVLVAFRAALQRLHPVLEDEMGPCETWRAGLRGRDGFDRAEVLLDAQICLNTPVRTAAPSVRGFHVDRSDKLFSGLYYMRTPDDRSRGGDLQIGRFRSRPRFQDYEIDARHVEVVKTIPYARNVLVLFLNGLHSVHGVTPRADAPEPRLFVNVVGIVKRRLFDVGPDQERLRLVPAARRAFSRLRARVAAR